MSSTGRKGLAVAGFIGLVLVVLLVGGAIGVVIGVVTNPDTDDLVSLPTPAPSVVPDATTKPIADQVNMQTLTDCKACHTSDAGGVGTKDIPALAHPLEGWTDCTGCHAPDKLVQTAPGHTGLHKDQCTVCHTKSSPPALEGHDLLALPQGDLEPRATGPAYAGPDRRLPLLPRRG
jgi:hypothetical protein